jgi:very-short-patch-repair endonuclease
MDADAIVDDLAAQQYGTAAVRQLRAAGISRHIQRRRVEARRWILQTPRVLRLPGAPESAEQRVMIAALDAGADAIASHETAAWLWRLPGFAAGEFVMRRREPTSGARPAHRPTLVLPHHRTMVRDIPCTTLPRTLFDLSSVLPGTRMERLVDTVITRSPAMLPALHRMFAELAKRGRPGIASMRRILADRPRGTVVPASGLERRFEEILKNAGLAPLARQVDLGGASWLGRVDYLDEVLRIPFEIDSALHHSSLSDARRDAARDAAMVAAGFREVVRIPEEDVWHRPWLVVEAVRAARSDELGTETVRQRRTSVPRTVSG